MSYPIAKKFNSVSIFLFVLPTVIMMLFISLYTIVDGIFISRLISTTALSALNIVYPFLNLLQALAIMFATGSSAIISIKIGENKYDEARDIFSTIISIAAFLGIFISIFSYFFINEIILFLGATPLFQHYAHQYLKIIILFAPFFILQILFQAFFVVVGKPSIGLKLTIFSGLTNGVLDYIFIKNLNWGMTGAALATAIGAIIISLYGIVFFCSKENSILNFTKIKFNFNLIKDICVNGSSEMVTNISAGIITFLFNIMMMQYLGEKGVAAITITLYTQFLFLSIYMGFSIGVSPIISYNYGAQNFNNLKKILKICFTLISVSSLGIFFISLISAKYIINLFTTEDIEVSNIALKGFSLFAITYIFSGFNIFSSALFTALSNGKTSAILSFMRTLVFIVIGIFTLPLIFKENGLWLAVPLAEFLSLILSILYLKRESKNYAYM